MSDRVLRIGLPVFMLALVLLAWDVVVRAFAIPPFVLPSPGLVRQCAGIRPLTRSRAGAFP